MDTLQGKTGGASNGLSLHDSGAVTSRSVLESSNQTELEEAQTATHVASVQLMTLDSVIQNMQQKETAARGLKHDLMELKGQIMNKLYKSVPEYLAMFPSQV